MSHLELSSQNPDDDVGLSKCMNLKSLNLLCAHAERLTFSLLRNQAVFSMIHLSKLRISHFQITSESVKPFERLLALHTLEFLSCLISWDWFEAGAVLAKTPLKSLMFRQFHKCSLEDIESLLESIKLDHLVISHVVFMMPLLPERDFVVFASAFPVTRTNPKAFLIELNGYARNVNGVMYF